MIVRSLVDIVDSDRDVVAETWRSRRLLLADDALGFSLHDTVISAGTTTDMWYKNHVEAVYCIEGTGQLIDRDAGVTYDLAPGTVYALDENDRHRVIALTDLRMVCVFTPAITGRETHDEDGAYPLLGSTEGSPA